MDRLLNLIREYQASVAEAEAKMEKAFKSAPHLWRQAKLSREGMCGQCTYSFHGKGCLFEFADYFVDYDYGHNWRTDAFDEWRLSRFGDQFPEYAEWIKSGKLESSFKEALKEGKVTKSNHDYDNLFYLSSG